MKKVESQNNNSVYKLYCDDLPYGTHTVMINHIKLNSEGDVNTDFIFNGFRVYDTIDPASSIYEEDNERSPKYMQIRDRGNNIQQVIASVSLDETL